jgi:hypothetical protein
VNTVKWFAIMVAVVVGEVLGFAAYVVYLTGTTDGLPAVGYMVAEIITSFMPR